jgi:hypothetical protein
MRVSAAHRRAPSPQAAPLATFIGWICPAHLLSGPQPSGRSCVSREQEQGQTEATLAAVGPDLGDRLDTANRRITSAGHSRLRLSGRRKALAGRDRGGTGAQRPSQRLSSEEGRCRWRPARAVAASEATWGASSPASWVERY